MSYLCNAYWMKANHVDCMEVDWFTKLREGWTGWFLNWRLGHRKARITPPMWGAVGINAISLPLRNKKFELTFGPIIYYSYTILKECPSFCIKWLCLLSAQQYKTNLSLNINVTYFIYVIVVLIPQKCI